MIELREGDARHRGGRAGQRVPLPAGGEAELLAPYLGGQRLWAARLRLPAPLLEYLAEHGEPIRYGHLAEARPLADYQTIFASEPGSAEMPSAGRPFTPRVLEALEDRGITVATVVLHTGVSSLERGERPYPERFRVPAGTLAAVRAANRVIAVGTTVVRALETAATGVTEGWTRLVVEPERGVQRRRRHPHRLARARRQPPADARGDRRPPAGRALVRGGAGRRLPLARVRRLAPAPGPR